MTKKQALLNYRTLITPLFLMTIKAAKLKFHNFIILYRQRCLDSGASQEEITGAFDQAKDTAYEDVGFC